MVFLSIAKQMGHINSLCKLRGDTAISVLSVITSCGVLCSSYNESSQVLFKPNRSANAMACIHATKYQRSIKVGLTSIGHYKMKPRT